MKRKILALLLACMMVIAMVPSTAFAANDPSYDVGEDEDYAGEMGDRRCTCGKSASVEGDTWLYRRPNTCTSWQYDAYRCANDYCGGVYIVIDLDNPDHAPHTPVYYGPCDADCNLCGATRVPGDHTYSNACDATCNVEGCNGTRTPADHVYDHDCDKNCNVCGATRTPAAHVYDHDCDADCNVCGETRTPADHVYTNACDADCNVCGATRTPAAHVYDHDCDKNCNVCGAERSTEHQYSNACDATCNVEGCDGTRTPAAHVYDHACDVACNVCGATRTPSEHEYDNACDADCNECGATRTPADHVYDNLCDVDCNVCGATRTVEPHTYNSQITTAPTCEGTGVETFTCTKCQHSYTAVVPATGHNPVMGPGVLPTCSSEGYTYKIICGNEGCDKVFSTSASIAKDYNRHGNFVDTGFTSGATCYENDHKIYMCEDCNGVDDEGNPIASAIQLVEIPGSMLPHDYDNACDTTCNVAMCGHVRVVEPHVYDNNCDADCNVCGATRTPSAHVYDNACDATCNVCGATRTPADHVYDNACDADCNVCGAERTPPHVYTSDCDETCNACSVTRVAPSAHVYDHACDTDCNVCGATRTIQHSYSNACDATCNVVGCGYSRTPADHVYGTPQNTVDPSFDGYGEKVSYCTVCRTPKYETVDYLHEEITFSHTVEGLGELNFAAVGGKVFVTVTMTVGENGARLEAFQWAMNFDTDYFDFVGGSFGLADFVASISKNENANANGRVIVAANVEEGDYETLEKGDYVFVTLVFNAKRNTEYADEWDAQFSYDEDFTAFTRPDAFEYDIDVEYGDAQTIEVVDVLWGDVDDSKGVDINDLAALLRAMKPGVSQEDLYETYWMCDVDKNGVINADDLKALRELVVSQPPAPRYE